MLERHCWSNAQCYRQETLEISGIPENIDGRELEGKVLTVLSKLDVNIDSANVEAYHWLKSNNKGKKAILKLSRRKNSDEIRRVRSKLKTAVLKSIGISTPVYINDSLYIYYKKLWSRCKKLWINTFVFGYWVSNVSIKIRISNIFFSFYFFSPFFLFKTNNALFLHHLGFALLFCSNMHSSHWPKLIAN